MVAPISGSQRLPPGTKFSPVLQTLLWTTLPERSMDYCAQHFGDIFTARLIGNRIYIVVSKPEHVRDVFVGFSAVGNDELLPLLGPNSLFVLDGHKHRQHRKILLPPLRRPNSKNLDSTISALCDKALSLLQPGHSVPVYDLVTSITLDVILKTIVGVSDFGRRQLYRTLIQVAMKQISGPAMFFEFLQKDYGRYSPGGAVQRTLKALRSELAVDLESRMIVGNNEGTDVMSLLLEARDEEGRTLTKDEIVDEIITLLFAGFEPTTAALAWALYWVHETASVAEKIVAEASSSAATGSVPKNTVYLDAVCKETLRIKPIVPAMERRVMQPTFFGGYDLPPGVRITPCAYLTHNLPQIYPDPTRFRPDRFLERQFSPYEYYPYGGGHRHCLGSHYSFYQLKQTLSELVIRCRFELSNNRKVTTAQRGATLGPSNSLKLTFVGWR